MNCVIDDGLGCLMFDVDVSGPTTATVGQPNTFIAVSLAKSFACIPGYKFYVDGIYAGNGMSSILDYSFTTPGYHRVEVRGYCSCTKFQMIHAIGFIEVYVQPEANSCPAANLTDYNCLTVTTETVAEAPANRARRKIGVGEEVTLTASKPVQWQLQGDGKIEVTDKKARFIAGEIASKPKIIAKTDSQLQTIEFEVIAPSNLRMERKCIRYEQQEPAELEWHAYVYVMPDDVSFANISIFEPFDATVKASTSGYFDYQSGLLHEPAGPADGAKISGIATIKPGKGTMFDGRDELRGGSKGQPYSTGSFNWAIPWYYQIKSGSGKSYQLSIENQQKVMIKDGTLILSKGGHSESNKIVLGLDDLCL